MFKRAIQVLRFTLTGGVLAAGLFVLPSCTAMHPAAPPPPPPPPPPPANPCVTGTPASPAIVCIDDSSLTVKPPANPPEVHGKRGAAIQWFTVSGRGSVGILSEDPDLFRDITCTPNGHCRAVVLPTAKYGTPYKYTIVLQEGGVVAPPNDPIIIINP